MKKVRIYEYAKEVGKQSKDLITVLKDANIEVSNHMSMLTEEGLAKLDSVFKKQEETTENEQSSNNEGKKNKKKKIKKIIHYMKYINGQKIFHMEKKLLIL